MLHQTPVVIVGSNKELSHELCSALENQHCRTLPIQSFANIETNIKAGTRHIVILDLDNLTVDNRSIRNLRKGNPEICIIVLSSRSFHPELKEAMSTHIYACLSKPVDTEELIYWIRSILEG